MKKIVCITGIDGAGKSSLVEQLHKRLPNSTVVNVWQSFSSNQHLFQSKEDVLQYLSILTPNSRLYFLAHALQYGLETAIASAAEIVLVDGYVYKYFGAELAMGADPELVKKLAATFPKPTVVFNIELPPAEALRRKGTFSGYESGFSKEQNDQAFIRFQEKVLDQLALFNTAVWENLDGMQPIEDLVKKVEQSINTLPNN